MLLPESMLARRADGVAVIGAALVAKSAGAGHRTIAAGNGRAASTVRGWLRRFGRRAEQLRVLSRQNDQHHATLTTTTTA